MISNTCYSKLKLEDQAGPCEYQQQFQLNTSTCIKVNSINETSKNKYPPLTPTPTPTCQLQSTNDFTFYATSGTVKTVPTNECTTYIIKKNCSNNFTKNSNATVDKSTIGESSNNFHYEPCSSKQDNILTRKNVNSSRNASAFNDVEGIFHRTDILTGDTTSIICNGNINSCSSNSSKSFRKKLPMYRTEDQEHACRQIEDVHNYSKLNRYDYCKDENSQVVSASTYSSNSSNQGENDDDEEEDEDEEEEEEEEFNIVDYEQSAKANNISATLRPNSNPIHSFVSVKATQPQNKKQESVSPDVVKIGNEGNVSPPDHHARRPMNAFLIFCKRHRGIVKDKYKNYENRSITKILGEWWASLDANDKKCYVNLAKQNKDAFFSANPNFKWYKLPAPSLRTLNTRPGNIERADEEYQYEHDDFSLRSTISPCDIANTKTKNVSYFKLADETQMGGLNNLICPNATLPSKNDVLQEALSEASKYFSAGSKRKCNTPERESSNFIQSHSDNSCSSSEDDLKPKKSVRSCKGKKYQEFINSGQITAVTSKKIISPKPSKILNSKESQYFVMRIDKCNKVIGSSETELLLPKKHAQSWIMKHYEDSEDFNKQQFGFVSFDLENKIRRLPAQCLETFLQRKKNTKRKKKINSKKRSSSLQPKDKERCLKQTSEVSQYQPKTAVEAKEQMVGSQKRKARKESITRRDITSINNDVQVILGNSLVTSTFVVESPTTQPVINQNATSDLLILAEVAANRTETAQ